LKPLLRSIESLQYDTQCYELIFIDDHSDDGTYEMINSFQKENDRLDMKVLKNDRPPGKKSALTHGIDQAKYAYVITTDADCYLPENWLTGFHQHLLRKKSPMIIAPVVYQQPGNFLEQFQHDDFLSLQAITLSTAMHNKPVLCNGANLCYKKDDFYKVGGFDQHEMIPSGDDVLPMRSWRQLVHQRKRWISKTSKTRNLTNFWLLFCLGIYIIGFWSLLISAFFDASYFQGVLVLIIFKWVMDYLIFRALADKINVMVCYKKMLISSSLYPLWIVYIVVESLHRSYNWKGEENVY
jgi:glycosyltransferase involved in cell wall biosynthesis